MRIRPLAILFSGLLLSACAGTTPPPRFSVLDPADPKAPESAVEPQPALLERPSEQANTPPAASEATRPGHRHPMESSSGDALPTADAYSCPMHPQLREARPGKCPLCGMTLVKEPAKPRGEHQP